MRTFRVTLADDKNICIDAKRYILGREKGVFYSDEDSIVAELPTMDIVDVTSLPVTPHADVQMPLRWQRG